MAYRNYSNLPYRRKDRSMKRNLLATIAFFLLIAPALPQAQSPADHQQHHPAGHSSAAPSQPSATPPTAPAQPPAVTVPPPSVPAQPPAAGQPQAQIPIGEMMQGMPEQCRGMMQNMPEGCRGMMQQMMQGGMMRQGMMPGQAGQAASQSEPTKAYMAAMERMNGPMMQGVQDSDADVAFVKSMIPHHQGAIEMAKVALQHGKDEQTKKWANDIVREQQREMAEMQEWLKKRGK
jgi:uncharacterized protein (DUF305 family)